MRILAISDEATALLYTPSLTQVTGTVDVLVGCGDLPYNYMEYVVTQTHVRDAFYVHGNHDQPQRVSSGRTLKEPGGWRNVDRQVIYAREQDLLIAGLEGSIRYVPGEPYQYTETEMLWRSMQLVPRLLLNRLVHGRHLDILIAHAPAEGIHDSPTGAHKGFAVFLRLIRLFRPRLFLHGHQHRYCPGPWRTRYEGTEIVNVHPFCIIDLDEDNIHIKSFPRC
ncbi:MAG: metallophosphoesterase family protein [Anaerolineae bacterium]